MKIFKKLLACLLAASMLAGVSVQGTVADDAAASDDEIIAVNTHELEISVNGETIDTSALPFSAYEVGGDDVYDLMVPLRAVCEALGYLVGWDEETEIITVDDGTKIMELTDGCMEVVLVGKLGDHSYDGKLPIAFPVKIHNGHTYVPLSLIQCLLTETMIYGKYVIINTMSS